MKNFIEVTVLNPAGGGSMKKLINTSYIKTIDINNSIVTITLADTYSGKTESIAPLSPNAEQFRKLLVLEE